MHRRDFLSLCGAGTLAACAATSSSLTPAGKRAPSSGKKGLGLAGAWGDAQLRALGVAWYYAWSTKPKISSSVPFVPMAFSPKHIAELGDVPVALGFNEPDNDQQAALSVADAVAVWPALAAKAQLVVSPAVAGNPVTGAWLPAFMAAAPRVDAVAVHWYKGPDAAKFKADIQAVIDAWHKPVWVTEFAPQTVASATRTPDKYAASQVAAFMSEVVAWMEHEPMVARYAWHDAKGGSSALFLPDGSLSPTGEAYAAARRAAEA